MRLTLSSKYKHEQSFSSRSGRGNSKRGINVTLSKEKQNQFCSQKNNQSYVQINKDPCQQKSQPNNNMSFIFNTINLQNMTSKEKISQKDNLKGTQDHSITDNHASQKQNVQNLKETLKQDKSPKSDLIGAYFMTTKQKQQAKKESQKLDEHIKKLQLQIYNTQSKITQTKYLFQNTNTNLITINSNNKKHKNQDIKNNIKYNHHYSQTQSIINPNQTNLSIKNHHSQFYSPNNNSNLNHSQIHKKSPLINDKKLTQNQLPISPSSSQPPHPFLLRQILTSQKQKVIKNPRLSQNLNNKIQPIHLSKSKNQCNQIKNTINSKNNKKDKKIISYTRQNPVERQKQINKDSISKKDRLSVPKNIQKSQKRNKSASKKIQTQFHQKRSYSVNLKDETIINNKKSLNISCQAKKQSKKPKTSDKKIKVQSTLSIVHRKEKQSIQNSLKLQKKPKNGENQIFSNQLLTKKVSSKRKKPTF